MTPMSAQQGVGTILVGSGFEFLSGFGLGKGVLGKVSRFIIIIDDIHQTSYAMGMRLERREC